MLAYTNVYYPPHEDGQEVFYASSLCGRQICRLLSASWRCLAHSWCVMLIIFENRLHLMSSPRPIQPYQSHSLLETGDTVPVNSRDLKKFAFQILTKYKVTSAQWQGHSNTQYCTYDTFQKSQLAKDKQRNVFLISAFCIKILSYHRRKGDISSS